MGTHLHQHYLSSFLFIKHIENLKKSMQTKNTPSEYLVFLILSFCPSSDFISNRWGVMKCDAMLAT